MACFTKYIYVHNTHITYVLNQYQDGIASISLNVIVIVQYACIHNCCTIFCTYFVLIIHKPWEIYQTNTKIKFKQV